MRKPGFMLFLAVLLGILAAAGWVVGHPAGPSYEGKSLQVWLDAYGRGPGGYRPNPQADDALRHMGTNAVPYLLHLLQTTNSPATTASWPEKLAASLPASWNRWKAVQGVQAWAARYTKAHARPLASWGHWQVYLAFQALGPLGRPALPELVKLAHDPRASSNFYNRWEPPGVDFWQDKQMVAETACRSATYEAPRQPPVDAFISWVVHPDCLVDGEIAAWSLAAIGTDSIPPLTAMLDDPSPRLRWRAEVALGMVGGAAEPAVPALVKMLDDPEVPYEMVKDPEVRHEVMDALGHIGRRPELALPPLIAALTSSNYYMELSAMRALGGFGGQATNAIPALLAFFPSHYSIAEPLAAAAVEKISPDVTTRVVVPLLLRDFQNTNPGIRLGALTVLCQMADPKAVPLAVLQEALDDPYERVRQEALRKLSRMPDQRALAVPALIRALDDPEPLVRNNAVIFLWNIGPEARAAAPKLITLTNDPDSGLRQNVIRALQEIDPGRWATNRP